HRDFENVDGVAVGAEALEHVAIPLITTRLVAVGDDVENGLWKLGPQDGEHLSADANATVGLDLLASHHQGQGLGVHRNTLGLTVQIDVGVDVGEGRAENIFNEARHRNGDTQEHSIDALNSTHFSTVP